MLDLDVISLSMFDKRSTLLHFNPLSTLSILTSSIESVFYEKLQNNIDSVYHLYFPRVNHIEQEMSLERVKK